MTTPNIAGLCERLLKARHDLLMMHSTCGVTDEMVEEANEVSAEAADTLERQAAEIERLRGTLGYYSYADDGGKRARAALTGEG
jgi:hypothetical protein